MKNKLEELENFLSTLPSISKKNAKKLSILFATQKELASKLILNINNINDIHKCPYCNNITNKKYCNHCLDNYKRNVIIINSFNDLINLERIGIQEYQPFIFDNDGKIDLEKIDLTQLNTFIDRSNIEEMIIFISPTIEGKILTDKIINLCKVKKVKISQLRIGIPFGANVETIDPITLKESLKKREEIK